MKKDLGSTGKAPLKKVGHTYNGRNGAEPNAKTRGVSAPTEITFG